MWSCIDYCNNELSLSDLWNKSMYEVNVREKTNFKFFINEHRHSLCPDCFHAGNHAGHDANMFRSIGGGVCDCGDITVMNSNGFCKHHGPNRIPNEQIPSKLIQSVQIILPRLILIHDIFSMYRFL